MSSQAIQQAAKPRIDLARHRATHPIMRKDTDKTKIPHKVLGLGTLISILFTGVSYFNTATDFWEKLGTYGIVEAATGSSVFFVLAGVTVLISIVYLISSCINGRRARKEARRASVNAEPGADLAAGSGEAQDTDQAAGRRSSVSILDMITRSLIVAGVIALVVLGVKIWGIVDEFRNRPTYDVLSGIDISQAITGYDGLGYVDEDMISRTVPEDFLEIYKKSSNYSVEEDYSGRQALWSQVLIDLNYRIEPDTSRGGTLSNGDAVTITAELPGYNIPKLESRLGMNLEGIGSTKEYTVSGLPYKYDDAAEAAAGQADFISAAYDRLKIQAYSAYNNFEYGSYGEFTFDGVYLCKPKHNEDTNPDALLILAHIVENPGREYEATHTFIFYSMPFDSLTVESDVENEDKYDVENGVLVRTEVFSYHTPDQVRDSFAAGIYFSATSAYELVELPWKG